MVIAQNIRNPAAHAVEAFARGQVEMQQFRVDDRKHRQRRDLCPNSMFHAELGLPRSYATGLAVIPDSTLQLKIG